MRKLLIEKGCPQLSVRRQSQLLKVNRNRLSPIARKATSEEVELCLDLYEKDNPSLIVVWCYQSQSDKMNEIY